MTTYKVRKDPFKNAKGGFVLDDLENEEEQNAYLLSKVSAIKAEPEAAPAINKAKVSRGTSKRLTKPLP